MRDSNEEVRLTPSSVLPITILKSCNVKKRFNDKIVSGYTPHIPLNVHFVILNLKCLKLNWVNSWISLDKSSK